MTAGELYTSLLSMYKGMMFPSNPDEKKWSMQEIDEMDIHFFNELLEHEPNNEHKPKKQKDVYITDVL